MDLSDDYFIENRDWDPMYLSSIFDSDFNDFGEMWSTSNISDSELVDVADKVERYCPITEDISLDDSELCSAVEKIEQE